MATTFTTRSNSENFSIVENTSENNGDMLENTLDTNSDHYASEMNSPTEMFLNDRAKKRKLSNNQNFPSIKIEDSEEIIVFNRRPLYSSPDFFTTEEMSEKNIFKKNRKQSESDSDVIFLSSDEENDTGFNEDELTAKEASDSEICLNKNQSINPFENTEFDVNKSDSYSQSFLPSSNTYISNSMSSTKNSQEGNPFVDRLDKDQNKDEEDDEIQICEAGEMTKQTRDEVMKRWNVKKLGDPNVNLSRCYYRLRRFKETPSIRPRVFKQGIFLDNLENKTATDSGRFVNKHDYSFRPLSDLRLKPVLNCEEESKSKEMDRTIFEKKLNKIKNKYKTDELERKNKLDECVFNLTKKYKRQIGVMKSRFGANRAKMEAMRRQFEAAMNELKQQHEESLATIRDARRKEENALNTLFESGNFKQSKLNEYVILDVYQPLGNRRNFFDNGHRQIMLTVNDSKNVLIEDEIYNFYYGKPTLY